MDDILYKISSFFSNTYNKLLFLTAYLISIVFPVIAGQIESILKPLLVGRLPDALTNDAVLYMVVYGLMGSCVTWCIKWIGVYHAKMKTEQYTEITDLKRKLKELKKEHKNDIESVKKGHESHVSEVEKEYTKKIEELNNKIADDDIKHAAEVSKYEALVHLKQTALDAVTDSKSLEAEIDAANKRSLKHKKPFQNINIEQ